jgi:hypothetical protein
MATIPTFPRPTAREARQVASLLKDSPDSSDLERAICIAVLRGYQTPKKTAKFLNVDAATIAKTAKRMKCFQIDAANGKMWFL